MGHWELGMGHGELGIGYWLLVIGYLLLVTPPQKPAFTPDSTLPFRRNAIASPNYPNDFAKFAPDSYFP